MTLITDALTKAPSRHVAKLYPLPITIKLFFLQSLSASFIISSFRERVLAIKSKF